MREEQRPFWLAIDDTEFSTRIDCEAYETELRRQDYLERQSIRADEFLTENGITGRSASRASNIMQAFNEWDYGVSVWSDTGMKET